MSLPITDGAWLVIESRETPQHVGGLMVFSHPEGASDTWLSDVWHRFRHATDFQPPFSYRLRRPYGRATVYAWEDDSDIDLDYHLRFSALPRPGRVRELFVLVSRLHSTLLDRHRPLWEVHLIEGLEGNRFAMYAKFHHSMFDGVGAMRVMRRMFSADPTERGMPAPWEIPSEARPPSAEEDTSHEVGQDRRRRLDPLRAVGTVARALRDQFSDTRRGVEGEAMPFSAPRSVLNGRITGSRRFAADGFALERMQQVAKGLGCTVNDVALAMSSHALRQYLDERSCIPDRSMTAMIPVSVRSEGEGAGGNALSFLIADLGTDLADPEDRLARIVTSMKRGKDRLGAMSRTERIGYALALTSPYVLGPMLGLAGRGRPVANIVISNVPGPREPRYFDGARLQGLYPASLLQQGQALNITLSSYDTEVQFGLTACRKTMPQMQRMLNHLEDGLLALEKLTA
ncbi:wax ester/triacylglycerol synthase family O-acyltransferase [soil metagenome]